MDSRELHHIAHIHTDFSEKFGIPRQSGLAEALTAKIIFLPEYRSADAVRGLEGFSHLWLLWEFSQAIREGWSPTVRPPRLGGNTRMGVFATRSPFRPNPIGLSCVKLLRVDPDGPQGPELTVAGADLLDGTPLYDLKPYLPYADSRPEARAGFTDNSDSYLLQVDFPPELLRLLPPEKAQALLQVLSHDPRPSYQNDPSRVYGMSFAGWNVHFSVNDGLLTVLSAEKI